jgi:hypothetical protein
LRGDEPGAKESFGEAVAADPFDPESACETLDASASPAGPLKDLCDAARRAAGPPFDSD